MVSRRTILTYLGAGGAVLGAGSYHQRRRIRRWSDRVSLRETREESVPDSPDNLVPPVSVNQLEDAVDELATAVEDARTAWEAHDVVGFHDTEVDQVERGLERAEESLEDAQDAQDRFSQDEGSVRVKRLLDLRRGLRGAASAFAMVDLGRESRQIESIPDEIDQARTTYERSREDLEYVGADRSSAVVFYSELDEWLDDARVALEAASRYLDNDPYRSYGRTRFAVARIADVERTAQEIRTEVGEDAHDVRAVFRGVIDDIEHEIEEIVEHTDFHIDEDLMSHAVDIWMSIESPHAERGREFGERGHLAMACRREIQVYAHVLTLGAFTEMPRLQFLDEDEPLPPEIDADGDAVFEEKTRAIANVGDQLAAHDDDPLITWLCQQLAEDLDRVDTRVGRTLSQINEVEDRRWQIMLEEHRLAYAEIAELAAALPTAVDPLRSY